ncbi:Phospholipase D/Transphosphatidylase [Penicillium macrosclerotiorum]|uniref:Phospholipase D/Transphosphatidylase n=1 Tax=Penicillium macrosclerotiorum TaxID=303699 RepID=UPI002548F87D|nr:Phospholipase D/Transphosphatidylase [Penicillium macrosclerotiorum]KAJ5690612.1 Phospholipase D/Transphosphatidylase [Penicillium macrosclerotiorum]
MSQQNDDLAYGRYHESERGSDGSRSLGDTFKKFRDTYKSHQGSSKPSSQSYGPGSSTHQSDQNQSQAPYGYSHGAGDQSQPYQQPYQQSEYQGHGRPPKEDKLSGFLGKIQGAVTDFGSEFATKVGTAIDPQAYAQYGASKPTTEHRFGSFAPPREQNDVKWYVDGCSYFWAVSRALETARESIWILDWWLSPELYLRRPPTKNEQYRLDRMLQAAAQRGVRVNVIVYKEVTQALTLSSAHTKHTLENLHPNISVFRHPDHLPDRQELASSITSSLQNLSLDSASLSKMSKDTLKGLYGMNDDVILYWAHHEKLCLVDGQVAFMGGLDMCFGRWDTNQHSIADLHPSDINETVFPGQDFNNSRVLDFQDVSHWENNQLDRKTMSRMGWSDISISLHGAVVEDLRRHFVERWNFIYEGKYKVRRDTRYTPLALFGRPPSSTGQHSTQQQNNPSQAGASPQPSTQPQQQQTGTPPPQWQGSQHSQPAAAPSYLPPPVQTSASLQQNQQQPTQSSYQAYQPNAAQGSASQSSTPIQGTHGHSQPQQQYNTASSYNPGNTQSYQPLPSQSPAPSQSSHQYSYTGDSFPPPPPGPPPSQSSSTQSYQPQQYGQQQHDQQTQASYYAPPPTHVSGSPVPQGQPQSQTPYYPPPPSQEASHSATRGLGDHVYGGDHERGLGTRGLRQNISQYGNQLRGELAGQIHQYQDRLTTYGRPTSQSRGNMSCQIVRSCAKWSNGSPLEHSIQDAYVAIIKNSQHFVYIENQFFITATGDSQHPVKNKIGAAIVERILRAARAGEKYKIIVVMPSVPCFAGDLRDDETLGTRAIMEFQYNSINRGGNSIYELIAKEGFNPMDYIRFYNLRNYDRIKNGSMVSAIELESGVSYEDARRQYDQQVAGPGGYVQGPPGGAPSATRSAFDTSAPYPQYQQAAQHQTQGTKGTGSDRWDTVASCYMLGGEDIRNVPWDGHPDAEIDAFVSEELYVHSKVMIADDRIVICGSANLNDRSQLGDHDSEIAVIIEDYTPVQSSMNGKPWMASRFAASLRRELCRKHLGLLPPQDYKRPNANYEPVGVPNQFDLDCPESKVVADPLSDTLQSLWNSRARTNTEVFRKVFHAVPDDCVRNWATYKEFYEYYFHGADRDAEGKEGFHRPARYQWGHVVRDDFAPGAEGAKQVKELLSQVKGNLVEMPLMFLCEEDIAKEGLTLNDLTEPLYT